MPNLKYGDPRSPWPFNKKPKAGKAAKKAYTPSKGAIMGARMTGRGTPNAQAGAFPIKAGKRKVSLETLTRIARATKIGDGPLGIKDLRRARKQVKKLR
jgi:hypothetical protein